MSDFAVWHRPSFCDQLKHLNEVQSEITDIIVSSRHFLQAFSFTHSNTIFIRIFVCDRVIDGLVPFLLFGMQFHLPSFSLQVH